MTQRKWAASVHLGYVLGEHPWEDRLAIASELGFSGVEFPFPQALAPTDYPKWLRDSSLIHLNVAFPYGGGIKAYRRGVPGIAVNDEVQAEFDEEMRIAIDYAGRIDSPCIHLFSGAPRPDQSPDSAWYTLRDNVAKVLELTQAVDMKLLVEPCNSHTMPNYLLDTPAKVRRLAAELDTDDIKMMIDIFHSLKMEVNPADAIREHGPMIEHVQLSDFPGRHEPGTGIIEYNRIFEALDAVNYGGYLGMEYVPTRDVRLGVPVSKVLSINKKQP